MGLEQISSWAEIIEAVVIIVSLIYLALQVRQNTQTTKAAAAQAQIDAYSSVISTLAQSKEGARAWFLGVQDVNALKEEQVVMFYAQANMFFRMTESSYYQHKNGVLDSQLWEGIENLVLHFWNQKGMQQYLEIRSALLSEEFRNWLNEQGPKYSKKYFLYERPGK